MAESYPNHGRIDGPIVIVGFGSIGRGALPLIERHFDYDRDNIHVIEPSSEHADRLKARGVRHIPVALTPENYREVLEPIFAGGKGFCVNLSVNVSSLDMMVLCRELGVLYIDTVSEPWEGFYFDLGLGPEARTNYALREAVSAEKRANPGGTTAVNCCGANPGMVSWLLKEALLKLAADLGHKAAVPTDRAGWARLMQRLGVRGVHVAERDTQVARTPRKRGSFVNTWSVDGFISESFQPAELGWGSHERSFPAGGRRHAAGCKAGIFLDTPGIVTRVRTWTPAAGPQLGFLVTHNEAISIADYYTIGGGDAPEFRPTCHYAYHPCDDAVMSLHETLGAGAAQVEQIILDEHAIASGEDCLGVLLYGHARNALWYGSRLDIERACALAPDQNATGLQVTSAVIAGMVWALENPEAGIVDTDEMDFARCLEIQRQYLGPIEAVYTRWNPLKTRWPQLGEPEDPADPWQFVNVLAR